MSTISQTLAEAKAAHSAGQLARAEELFRQVVAADPANFEVRYLHGAVCHRLGRPREAIASLTAAIRLKPDYAAAHNHLGAVLAEQRKLDEAIASFQRACQLDPQSSAAASNLRLALAGKAVNDGFPLAEQGRLDEAAACFYRALEFNPNQVDAHNNLGFVLQAKGKPNEAIPFFRKAVELTPDYLPAHINLGSCLERIGQASDALPVLRRAVQLGPELAETHNNLGVALYSLGQLDEAMTSFAKALKLQPDHSRARLNHGLGLLLRGNFAEGWPEYEFRATGKAKSEEVPAQPRWTGEPLDGRTILLRSEEGIGDTLQFVRYSELLKRHGATVIVECPHVLTRLLATCRGVDRVVATGEPLPKCDFYLPILSVAGVLGTSLESIPAQIPYLWPAAELVERWKNELAAKEGFKVGIAWQGNPNHKGDCYRSIPLAQFAPIARVPGVHLYSLQMGPGHEQLAAWLDRWPITDLSDRLGDFFNTAAAVRNLDLVITCDSAPAHVAGALGVPVWLALAITPDWRWMLKRNDSPWYPTARLFRQQRQGDWQGVFHEIKPELAKVVAAKLERGDGSQ